MIPKENKLVKEHLAKYKNETLKISVNGKWKGNKKEYAHILPKEFWKLNIINSKYYQMIIGEIESNNIKRHSDFHHLNSSQALCFNLFFPIIFEDMFDIILKEIIYTDIESKGKMEYQFEHIVDEKENTNFDLYIETNQVKYYFEIKYTENEFGKAKKDERHISKYNNIYKEKLIDFNNVNQEVFFRNYQIFRNLIYNDGYNIFVFPEFRDDLRKTINRVIENYCTKRQQKHIIILPIEKIIEIMLDSNNKKLIEHYKLFSDKYFLSQKQTV